MPEHTLPELLQRAAADNPASGIYYFKDDSTVDFQSYGELLSESKSLACGLLSMGINPGDKVIIATENNRETLTLLWGCFLAGMVPTILQPLAALDLNNPSVAKLLNVFRQMGNPYIFTAHAYNDIPGEFSTRIVPYSLIPSLEGAPAHKADMNDLAFIQFSSGSTGDPKGIMLTHSNIASNMESIVEGLDMQTYDPIGNWMPLYHDMGLIGYHLTPLSCPTSQFHIHTIDFIKNPSLWPEMMSRYKIAVTGCPNFGQELLIRYLKRRPDGHSWDLSHLKALLNGAEPISVKVMNDFNRALKPYGFREVAMMPVYGMAEATLAISFTPLMNPTVVTDFDNEELDKNFKAVKPDHTKAGKHIRTIVGVGKALNNIEIRIADVSNKELPEGKVGHILVRGKSVTRGYFQNPEATKELFTDNWLKTGDMGFVLEGNLYISGRFKDIIFANGKNYFANDLEALACTLEEFSFGKTIIGGITDYRTGKEKVLVFAAAIAEAKAPPVLDQLRTLMREELGIPIDELILIKSNEIPKTSSGKIQRYKVIQRYQQGAFAHSVYR